MMWSFVLFFLLAFFGLGICCFGAASHFFFKGGPCWKETLLMITIWLAASVGLVLFGFNS